MVSTHTPHARRDVAKVRALRETFIVSTHTPHARRDEVWKLFSEKVLRFQLTRLMRGVTIAGKRFTTPNVFQLTRLMRGVTYGFDSCEYRIEVSTHTPHARRDCSACKIFIQSGCFNSHASCEA